MKTNFSVTQLQDPKIAEADGIIQTCNHYGFCTATCPTYVLRGDENEGPRGRIDLIRNMLERGGSPDPKTVEHLDNCLSCLGCMSTCAVRVDYMHLIDRARVHIERNFHRPWADRAMRAFLAWVLPSPTLFRIALKAAGAVSILAPVMPAKLRRLMEFVPKSLPVEPRLAEKTYAAVGSRRMRVALLAGCAQQVLAPQINLATIRMLTRHGCEVVVSKRAGCCGSLTLHMGREENAKQRARANVRAWTEEAAAHGLDAIVINASGCGTTVKDYAHLLADDRELAEAAKKVAALACDVSELVDRLEVKPPSPPKRLRVAYHDACSLRNAQRVTQQPRKLLRAAGFSVVDVPEGHFCCGSAGTYNLLQPETAAELGRRKASHIQSTGAQIVAVGNIGCISQLQHYTTLPVVHTIELLDWATGGRLPPALERVALPAPEAQSESDGCETKSQVAAIDTGTDSFW